MERIKISVTQGKTVGGIIIPLALVLIFALVAVASATDLVMVNSVDGYTVKMTVLCDGLPVVGANQIIFELRDSSGKEVADIADIGVNYEVAGFAPRKIMPVTKSASGYSGVLNVSKAAIYDVFFVFEARGQQKRIVRFSFQTRDNAQTGQQNK
ncbi:hypothetical protein [Candidatus Magnetominusculus dajiuhuensis]|uniref:hypothetical protein n=1 Tax=Candidatus Magnetominusculus dajiuhuensis TaxID=3137712 RepID=UPI003B436DEC